MRGNEMGVSTLRIQFALFILLSSFAQLANAEPGDDHLGLPGGGHWVAQEEKWESWDALAARKLRDVKKDQLKDLLEEFPMSSIPAVPAEGLEMKYPEPLSALELTAAEKARLNIRTNLKYYKSKLVKRFMQLVKKYPPKRPAFEKKSPTDSDVITDEALLLTASNKLADAYIKGVDKFLKTHHGARPYLGSRNEPEEDEFSAPWCADWATGISDHLSDAVFSDKDIRKVFGTSYAQYHSEGRRYDTAVGSQHNYNVVYPVGHRPPEMDHANAHAIIIDPWKTITPEIYETSSGTYEITNLGVRQDAKK